MSWPRWVVIIAMFLTAGGFCLPAWGCLLREADSVPTVIMPLKYENRRANVSYHYEMLAMALDKSTKKYGPCEARVTELYLPSNRLNLHSVESGLVDIIDTTTSPERDQRLLPVRIPLLKGLMGYRLLFIRKGEQPSFTGIKTLSDVRALSFGQGGTWPDVTILKANGITAVPAVNHISLMKMLLAKRFDAYPRGAQQILVERSNRRDNLLDIEKTMGLAYVSPVYFHVGPNNKALAERIQFGLELAIADGSFEKLFRRHALVKRAFEELHLESRRFIYLCNPYLHPDTPVDKTNFWWRPWPKDLQCKK